MESDGRLDRVLAELGVISTRIAIIEAQLAAGSSSDSDHEVRLRAVEKWLWGIPASLVAGAAALASALTG